MFLCISERKEKVKLFCIRLLTFLMIANKSVSIRLGFGRNWPVKSTFFDWSDNLISIKLHTFLETYFMDDFFRSRGIIFSNVAVGSFPGGVRLSVFLQDAKIIDFSNTMPRRSVFSRKVVLKRHKKFRSVFVRRRQGKCYFVCKGSLFFRPHGSFVFDGRGPKLLRIYARKFLPAHKLIHRYKFRRRRNKFRPTRIYFQLPRRLGSNFYRVRFYVFLGKFLSSLLSMSLGYRLMVHFSFFPLRHATANFYLNYITTKLYYRYILSDVVNPIVRLSLRAYRGFAINCKGRFTRAQIAIQRYYRRGRLGFSSLKVPLDYAQKAVVLKYGTCNLKIWIRHLSFCVWLLILFWKNRVRSSLGQRGRILIRTFTDLLLICTVRIRIFMFCIFTCIFVRYLLGLVVSP